MFIIIDLLKTFI